VAGAVDAERGVGRWRIGGVGKPDAAGPVASGGKGAIGRAGFGVVADRAVRAGGGGVAQAQGGGNPDGDGVSDGDGRPEPVRQSSAGGLVPGPDPQQLRDRAGCGPQGPHHAPGPHPRAKGSLPAVWSRLRSVDGERLAYDRIVAKNPKHKKIAVVARMRVLGVVLWHEGLEAQRALKASAQPRGDGRENCRTFFAANGPPERPWRTAPRCLGGACRPPPPQPARHGGRRRCRTDFVDATDNANME